MNRKEISKPADELVVVQGHGTADISRARHVARAFATRLSPPPTSSVTDALLLMVSELVTNAVRHGGGRYVLELSATSHTMHVSVSDLSRIAPRERIPDRNGEGGGFGWPIICSLAQSVTITTDFDGKTIHTWLARQPPLSGNSLPQQAAPD